MTNSKVIDESFMRQAIQLAQLGRYTTTPNPNVGCIIVAEQRVVGSGFHQQAGGAHAEVFALAQAGSLTVGATAYVSLEPCSHYGKTPPCADALIAANISRVVIAMQDPNPQVAGRGIQRLRDSGIQVDVGVLADEARMVNRGFVKRMTQNQPWLTTKLASTLDGKTALSNGQSQWITGKLARRDVQMLRAEYCAILTGADTILADNPRLNVRLESSVIHSPELSKQAVRQPTKVIIDSQNRLSANHNIFQMSGSVIVANAGHNPRLSPDSPMCADVIQWQIPKDGQYLNLNVLLTRLAEFGFNNLWCEAGAKLNGALLKANLIDELIVYQAPKVFGTTARCLFDLPGLETIDAAPQFQVTCLSKVGEDVKLTLHPQAPSP